jgi:selenocysteine lyase/cysteine desulfurase
MNEKTLEKLKSNPHYKLSKEQDKKPMVQFGIPKVHNQTVKKHKKLKKVHN